MRGPLALAAAVLVLDQAAKAAVLALLTGREAVTGFLNLVLVANRGISFGLFQDMPQVGRWLWAAVALGISGALLVWMRRTPDRLLRYALAGIVGGALGNAIDRVRLGAVVDFVDLHAFGYHWPAFNLADAAITVGAVVLVADSLLGGRGEDEENR